jgi:hypothetical protein
MSNKSGRLLLRKICWMMSRLADVQVGDEETKQKTRIPGICQ